MTVISIFHSFSKIAHNRVSESQDEIFKLGISEVLSVGVVTDVSGIKQVFESTIDSGKECIEVHLNVS